MVFHKLIDEAIITYGPLRFEAMLGKSTMVPAQPPSTDTDIPTNMATHQTVSSEYILATIMIDLFERRVEDRDTIQGLYRTFYRKLVSRTYSFSFSYFGNYSRR
jgi:hypothetical protein